jgi:hypothetical protein
VTEVCDPPRTVAATVTNPTEPGVPTQAPREDEEPASTDSATALPRTPAQLLPQVRAQIEEQTRLLAFAQEWYFNKQGEYARVLASLTQVFTVAPGVAIAINEADEQSWSARIVIGGTSCDVSHSVSSGSVTECR